MRSKMDTASFQGILHWVIAHGYTLLFILMFIEGPVVTAAGAFAAALGYFNIWLILLISVLANLIPDFLYYAMGYWGRHALVDKYGHYFGVTPERMIAAEKLAHKHSGKSLLMIKLVPFLATPGLIVVGATKMDLRKYTFWSVVITVPTSGFYLILGYYFGAAYATIDSYMHIGEYVLAAGIIIFFLIIYLQRKYSAKILGRIEGEKNEL